MAAPPPAPPPAPAPPPFNKFGDLYNPLVALLDRIKSEAPKGKPVPETAPNGDPLAAPGTTDTGAKEYGDAVKKAKDLIKPVTDGMTPEQINFCSGLGFTDQNNDDKKRGDILGAVQSAWDASAAKYMKQAQGDGDGLRPTLQARLHEFDVAVQTAGKTAVKPDQ
jgi:hypothetical protein